MQPRSASWTSGRGISPRLHHALYKEYRLLETIGKGAFGTVSIAVRRSDGKKLVAKEISQSQAALATAKQREAIMDEVRTQHLLQCLCQQQRWLSRRHQPCL